MKHAKAESSTVLPSDSLVSLESVLCTEELNRRPSRAPDYQAENRALVALAQALADSPRTTLQRLAQMILEVFQADSASIWLRDLLTVVVEDNWATSLRGVMFDITERKRADEELRERERRYRSIFQGAGVSIWEEDFSQVKAAIDDLKTQGVRNFRQYTAAHPEFIRQAISMVKIIDVNDATVRLFGAQSKDEL